MPWLGALEAHSDTTRTWHTVFKQALLKRYRPEKIEGALKKLRQQNHAKSSDIAMLLMGFRGAPGSSDDPLLFAYTRILLKERIITASDLLDALLKRSGYGGAKQFLVVTRRTGMPSCEERMFNILINFYADTTLPTAPLEINLLVHAVYRWLQAVSEYEMGRQLEDGSLHTVDAYLFGLYEALGNLALVIFANKTMRQIAQQRWWKTVRARVVSEMRNFDTHVLQWMNCQRAGELTAVTGLYPFVELDSKGQPVFSDQQILAFIPEVAVLNSRAGLFVWLNAALVALPLTDDMSLLSYLQARYNGDTQSLFVDLLVACFDTLTNALLRRESRQDVKVAYSFLCDKIPVLMSLLSGSVPLGTPEACISMALHPSGMISMDPLPPFTAGATEIRDKLKTARLDFLQACHMHGLISENAVSVILQNPVALPRITKLSKETLVSQCANNIRRFEALFEDLEAMQGNAAAISGCIVITLNNICLSKDTMALKAVCNVLLKKIARIDIVLQHTQPRMLLVPLSTILNEWAHDQDQTEFTPAYEEFASILLCTLAIVHRYGLERVDLGVMDDTFMAGLFDDLSPAKDATELSSEQSAQLSKWIEALFAVDEHGEASGIGDEVMRHCSPQSFYQLVPALFQQSVLACQSNVLPLKTFKSGLELLLEPFLLPALVMGLKWLAEHSWEDHNDADILLAVSEKLLKPSSSSEETKSMHRAVICIVVKPLFLSLQELLRKHPEKSLAAELSDLIKPYLGQQRTMNCPKSLLDQGIQAYGSISNSVRHSVQELVTWASTLSNPPNPPPRFSYKEFATACQVLEDETILDAIVADINQSSNLPVALDAWTSIICAPIAQQTNTVLHKLQTNIRLTTSNLQALQNRKVEDAQAMIRLGRRVEAQISVAQMPPMALPIQQLQDQQTADQIMKDMGIEIPMSGKNADVEAAIDQNGNLTDLDQALDLSNATEQEIASIAANANSMEIDQSQLFSDLNLDMSQGQTNSQQMGGQAEDDDIFAGLGDMDNMGMNDLDDFM